MKLLSTITSLFVDGISYGMVLFLISVGLTVTLGVMRVANLAHCGFAMIGGYAAYALMGSLGLAFVVALPVATVLVVVLGFVLERTSVSLGLCDRATRSDFDDDRSDVRHGRERQSGFWFVDACVDDPGLGCREPGRNRRSRCRGIARSSSCLASASGDVFGLC